MKKKREDTNINNNSDSFHEFPSIFPQNIPTIIEDHDTACGFFFDPTLLVFVTADKAMPGTTCPSQICHIFNTLGMQGGLYINEMAGFSMPKISFLLC